jgi:Animal haem peroxidase
VTQWGFVWGQFMDQTFGLRQEAGGENAPLPFSSADPLETFTNTLGAIPFTRTPAAAGTGTGTKPRQQINTVSSYIDGFTVYGGTASRLEWLREGPVDGKLANNGAKLLMQNGYLPRADARGNAATAPVMALMGRLGAPGANAKALVAATGARTRTSGSRRPRRSSRVSTTASSRSSRTASPRSRSSRSPAGSSGRSSSGSPTRSSSRRWA